MKTKLTREDFEGYLSQVMLSAKRNEMERRQNKLVLEWLQKELKKYPPRKED